MLKRVVLIILILSSVPWLFNYKAQAVSVSAKSAVLIEAVTGKILFSQDCDTKRPEASTTKIMTALVTLENSNLDDIVTCSKNVTLTGGTSIYLKEGERIKVGTLLYGLLLESGNDAAEALAEYVGHGRENFVKMMNERAKKLGLKNTRFANPSGLPGEDHFTTAYELALIAREAFKNPVFEQIVSTKSISIPYMDGQGSRHFKNHNSLLSSCDGADGVKTGFTKEAGRCLVASATRGGVRLIAVTLKDPNDWQDHREMFDYGFTRVSLDTFIKAGEIKEKLNIGNGVSDTVSVTNPLDINCVVIDGDKSFQKKIILSKFVFAPVKKGKILGEIQLLKDNVMIGTSPLCAENDIANLQGEKSYLMIFLERFRLVLFSVLP